MGANAETVSNPGELAEAFTRAKAASATSVIVMNVDPHDGWTTGGHAWWEIGMPEVSDSESVRKARSDTEAARIRQRKGV